MGVTIGDYDHRGRWSIVVTNFSDEYNALYRHEKDFLFTDASYATQTAKASLPFVGWGAGFFDYDNDGWLDLHGGQRPRVPATGDGRARAPTYRQRKLLYRNERDGTFSEVGAAELGPGADRARPSAAARRSAISTTTATSTWSINNLDGPPDRACATTAATRTASS